MDGPNVYTYVRQNPWTYFDPLGLQIATDADIDAEWDRQGGLIKFFGKITLMEYFIKKGLKNQAAAMRQAQENGVSVDPFTTAKNFGTTLVPDLAINKITRTISNAISNSGDGNTPEDSSTPKSKDEKTKRIQHATDESEKIMEEQKIESESDYVYGREAETPGQAPTKQQIEETGAKGSDKVIEFDAKPSEYEKDELGDVKIPKPVDLTNRNPVIIDIPNENTP